MKKLITIAFAALLLSASPAWAADATLFGAATKENGVVKLVSDLSDTSTANDFSGINIPVSSGTTFAQLQTLSAEYNVTDDGCGGGSPRFQITLASGKVVHVAIGPSPSFTGCQQNTWLSTGNLIGNNDACRYDLSQVQAGTQCSTYAQALALIGTQQIRSIQLVVDAGWFFADKEQTVLVRNVRVNNQRFFPTQGGGNGKATVNAAKLCKQQRTAMGSAAFNELWGTNGNDRNGYGKCVSTVSKARNAGATQEQILAAITACKAQGKSGSALGACVAARDGVAATLTEAQESSSKSKDKGKGKGKGK